MRQVIVTPGGMYLYAMCPYLYNFVLDGVRVEAFPWMWGLWELEVLFHPALVRWGIRNSGDALAWRDCLETGEGD